MAPRAARVREHPVLVDPDRVLGLDHLDRDVRLVRSHVGHALLAVVRARRPPRPHERLAEDERLAAFVAGDGGEGGAARGVRRHPVGEGLGKRAEQAVDDPVAGDAARPAGGGEDRADERAARRGHRDRDREPVAVRDVRRHHGAERGVARRLREREGRVDAPLDLVRGAGPVDGGLLARHRHLRPEHHELRLLAEPLDVVGELVDPVREPGDLGPGEPFRVVLEAGPVVEHRIDPVAREQVVQLALAAPARRKLGLEVPHHLVGGADVEGDHVPEGLVRLARGDELDDGETKPLLEYLLRPECVAAGDDPADVGVVRHGGGPGREALLRAAAAALLGVGEDGGGDVDVGEVLPVGGVGVVEDEDVARIDPPRVFGDELPHRVVEAPHVHGGADPLREGEPVRVEEGGREVERVAHDPRMRGPHQGEGHVVGDRVEAALEELELEGVDVGAKLGLHAGAGSLRRPARAARGWGFSRRVRGRARRVGGGVRSVAGPGRYPRKVRLRLPGPANHLLGSHTQRTRRRGHDTPPASPGGMCAVGVSARHASSRVRPGNAGVPPAFSFVSSSPLCGRDARVPRTPFPKAQGRTSAKSDIEARALFVTAFTPPRGFRGHVAGSAPGNACVSPAFLFTGASLPGRPARGRAAPLTGARRRPPPEGR